MLQKAAAFSGDADPARDKKMHQNRKLEQACRDRPVLPAANRNGNAISKTQNLVDRGAALRLGRGAELGDSPRCRPRALGPLPHDRRRAFDDRLGVYLRALVADIAAPSNSTRRGRSSASSASLCSSSPRPAGTGR